MVLKKMIKNNNLNYLRKANTNRVIIILSNQEGGIKNWDIFK